MILNSCIFKNSCVVDHLIAFSSRLHYFMLRKMEDSVSDKVTKLLQRLNEAERRAKLLKGEIKDIREQIAGLTQSANSILSETGATSSSIILRHAHTLATSSTVVGSALKRQREETDSVNANQPKQNRWDPPMENGYVVVYTDGACEKNGKANARAGIGAWFGDGHHLNISEPVKGRATNNTAEIQAPTEALKLLQSHGYGLVKILTDSQFTINCMTKWIKRWKKNQWKLAGGGPVKNKEDLVRLDDLCQQFQHVKWEYCAGHKGIKGNEEADKLAKEGALRYRP